VTDTATPLHIYFLLDRSGSMNAMAEDVIGGFNSFLASQRADGPDALLTLVQFDSHDPHEVLADAVAITQAAELTRATFVPRGGTPLYDAMGHLVADATIRAEQRRASGQAAESILFVTFTDGMENQSREYSRAKIRELITKREADGWSFVYLGANQDSYAEAGDVGFRSGNIQNFAPDGQGSREALSSLSSGVLRRRGSLRSRAPFDSADLFEGDKEAEDDLNRRQP
jgi:Mg-chelatase subunit ChlD